MNILVAADMEGISGVTSWEQVDPNHSEYSRFRKLMTGEVNAAVKGAFAGGAHQVRIADGHAYGRNLLIEGLDGRVLLNTGSPSPFSMVQGIDASINGVIFVGYHARAGTANAILDHTWSSSTVSRVWLNGQECGEIGLNAAVCGHFGVPVIMIAGDQSACAEARALLGEVETAVVKQANGRNAAECLPPEAAHTLIRTTAMKALERLKAGDIPGPYQPELPIALVVDFPLTEQAERAALYPHSERVDGRQIRLTVSDALEVYRAFRAIVNLALRITLRHKSCT